MFASGIIRNDKLKGKANNSPAIRGRPSSSLFQTASIMQTDLGGRRPSGHVQTPQYLNQRRSSGATSVINNVLRRDQSKYDLQNMGGAASNKTSSTVYPSTILEEESQGDTMRDLLTKQLSERTSVENNKPPAANDKRRKMSRYFSKEYGSLEIRDMISKYTQQEVSTKLLTTHGGNPPLAGKMSRENYILKKRCPLCPCISYTSKKQQSIFGSDPAIKIRKIHEMWKSIIKKVILINRVFYTMKQLNHDIKFFGATHKNIKTKGQVKNEYVKEQIHNAFCIIMPESQIKLFWSMIMIILLLITMIYVPYRTAFIDEPPLWLLICEYIMDCLFAIDIILCFMSSYYDDQDNLVTNHFTIAKNYIKGWFILDIIATFPFGLLEDGGSSGGGYNKLLRLLRLPRLYRLIRILRLLKMVKVFKYSNTYEKISFYLQMNAGLVRLLKALAYMLFFVHFYGCVWFWFAKLGDFDSQCWVVRYGLRDASQGAQYLASVYWVLTTATTVGYGDIHPVTKTERGLAILLMIFGVAFYSYTVGNLSAILNTMDMRNQNLFAKMFALNKMAKQSDIPDNLIKKVQKILADNHELHLLSTTDDFLAELPTALRTQLIMYLHKKALNNICFFWNKDPAFLTDVTSYINKIRIGDGELVYKAGDPAEAIYFITKGRVRMIDQDGYIYRTYVEGSLFGEYEALNEPYIRNHYALTFEDTELMILYQNDLFDLLEKYPEIKLELDAMASLRAEKNEEALNLARKGDIRLSQIEREIMMTNPNFAPKTDHRLKENLEQRMTEMRSEATLNLPESEAEDESFRKLNRSTRLRSKSVSKRSTFLDTKGGGRQKKKRISSEQVNKKESSQRIRESKNKGGKSWNKQRSKSFHSNSTVHHNSESGSEISRSEDSFSGSGSLVEEEKRVSGAPGVQTVQGAHSTHSTRIIPPRPARILTRNILLESVEEESERPKTPNSGRTPDIVVTGTDLSSLGNIGSIGEHPLSLPSQLLSGVVPTDINNKLKEFEEEMDRQSESRHIHTKIKLRKKNRSLETRNNIIQISSKRGSYESEAPSEGTEGEGGLVQRVFTRVNRGNKTRLTYVNMLDHTPQELLSIDYEDTPPIYSPPNT